MFTKPIENGLILDNIADDEKEVSRGDVIFIPVLSQHSLL